MADSVGSLTIPGANSAATEPQMNLPPTWTPRRLAHIALGLAVVGLGSSVTLGWLLQLPMMVTLKRGALPLVFNTGLGFLLAGTTALSLGGTGRAARFWSGVAPMLLLALSISTLVEIITDRNFGIDLAGIHAWFDYGNVRPGRMAPNSACGFS